MLHFYFFAKDTPIAVLQYSNFIQTFNYVYAETQITFIN